MDMLSEAQIFDLRRFVTLDRFYTKNQIIDVVGYPTALFDNDFSSINNY